MTFFPFEDNQTLNLRGYKKVKSRREDQLNQKNKDFREFEKNVKLFSVAYEDYHCNFCVAQKIYQSEEFVPQKLYQTSDNFIKFFLELQL